MFRPCVSFDYSSDRFRIRWTGQSTRRVRNYNRSFCPERLFYLAFNIKSFLLSWTIIAIGPSVLIDSRVSDFHHYSSGLALASPQWFPCILRSLLKVEANIWTCVRIPLGPTRSGYRPTKRPLLTENSHTSEPPGLSARCNADVEPVPVPLRRHRLLRHESVSDWKPA